MTESLEEKFTRNDRDKIIILDTKVDAILKKLDGLENNFIRRVESAEKRLDKLESWRWKMVGIVAGSSCLVGIGLGLLVYIYRTDQQLLEGQVRQLQVSQDNNRILNNNPK